MLTGEIIVIYAEINAFSTANDNLRIIQRKCGCFGVDFKLKNGLTFFSGVNIVHTA